MKTDKNTLGQATIEYLVIFAFLGIISVTMMKSLATYIGDATGGIAFELTQELASGVCERHCWSKAYKNGMF